MTDTSTTPERTGASRIARLEITGRLSPAFGGRQFGTAGAYELLTGRAHALADPESPRNREVTDLALAPRNAQGLVEYGFDFALLKPVRADRANGTLVHEVCNRGRKMLMPALYGGTEGFVEPGQAGAGFALEDGFTLAWSGWQGDIAGTQQPDGSGLLGARYPVVHLPDGRPVTGWVHDEFLLDGEAGSALPAVDAAATFFDAPLSYPPAFAGVTALSLSVRRRGRDQPETLPADSMTLLDARTVRVTRAAGMDQGALYRIRYLARDPMAGLCLAGIRDFVSFLRHAAHDDTGAPNPLAGGGADRLPGITRTVCIGLSQSGRLQRDFLHLDFNRDEQARPVFDGMMPSGAGAKRGFFHQRFAQPNRSPDLQHEARDYPGAQFPFTYPTLSDPVTGRTDGILARSVASGSCPKVIHIDSDWEQWQQAGFLVVNDPLGQPVALPESVRAYLIAGMPHSVNLGPPVPAPQTVAACAHPISTISWAPVFRALVFAMQAWIRDAIPPPASCYPAGREQGRRTVEELGATWPAIPGLAFSPLHGQLHHRDFSGDAPRLLQADAYPIRMMRVDADGNPFDGVVMPELAVPVATYSGRNLRGPLFAPGELCGTRGMAIAFAPTRARRAAQRDPRASIEERYRDDAHYRALLRAAAERLVQARLMLPRDALAYEACRLPAPG